MVTMVRARSNGHNHSMKSHNGSTQWLKPYIYVITCNFTMVNEILDLLIHITLQFINRSSNKWDNNWHQEQGFNTPKQKQKILQTL